MRDLQTLMYLFLLSAVPLFSQSANHVVISEVYGGGGNSGSTWKNDFVELYNPTNAPVDITGWSVQYASAAGVFGNFKTFLSGTIQPKSFFLIQESQGAANTKDLPTPDAVGVISMASTAGKIALVKDTLTIVGPADASVIDFVGYGGANLFEGSGPAAVLSNTTSAERKASATSTAATLAPGGSEEKAGNGWDANNNANDFVAQSTVNPQNSASPKEPLPAIQAGVGLASISPQIVKADTAVQVTIVVRGVPDAVITSLRFAKYALFDWSHSSVAVSVSNGGQPLFQQSKDSITIGGVSISASDSVQIRISGLATPDSTLKVTFRLETGAGSDSTALVTPLPTFVLYGIPRAIAAVKVNDAQGIPLHVQKPVTVRGIVTVAKEFGGPAYVQDVSGGLAVFDLPFENAVKIGDEVTITGTVSLYNGLTELTGVTLHRIHGNGNDVAPLVVTCAQLAHDGTGGIEFYEGMLVQLNRVTVGDASGQPISVWSVNGSGSNFWLRDKSESIQIRIDGDVASIVNMPAPTGEFDVVGVVGQFVTAPPFTGGYQVMPRFSGDIFSKGPVITVLPQESSITPTTFALQWETAKPGSNFARYGRTRSYELGVVGDATPQTVHRITISGLSPATVYHVQAFSVSGSDTSFAGDRIVSTASQGSSGQMNVYFNKSIDPSVVRRDTAKGTADLASLLLRRINAAQKSIDCALYSMSGTVGQTIADALVRARTRGVTVRVIMEHDNFGFVPNQTLVPSGIPCIADDFDPVNAGLGLMHNKFFVFDYRGGTSDQTWVWTGSWNLTDSGTLSDMQNAIEIQDQALAAAYTIEFNEMWGSETNTPDPSSSRFGARKLDNTPHVFNINGVPVELYFSPSDGTTSHIISTLDKAQSSINVAMLTFTRSDIAAELKSKKTAGLKVRCLLDNNTDTGSQFSFLASSGIDTRLKSGSVSGLLHHKYAVIDAELTTVPQYVITGSHNWSSSAENSNNENTLIVQSSTLANQYLQEFVARYKAAGGTDNIVVGVERTGDQTSGSFVLAPNYPNPFNGTTTIEFQLVEAGIVTLRIYDLLGREVETLVDRELTPGVYRVRWAADVPSGIYYCALRSGHSRAIRPMVLMK